MKPNSGPSYARWSQDNTEQLCATARASALPEGDQVSANPICMISLVDYCLQTTFTHIISLHPRVTEAGRMCGPIKQCKAEAEKG